MLPLKQWSERCNPDDFYDARSTAQALGLGAIEVRGHAYINPIEFEQLGATNHCAKLGAKIGEMYPDGHERPDGRKYSHCESVWWHMNNKSSPVIVFADNIGMIGGDNETTKYIVLDGAHRLAAAFAMRSWVQVCFVGPLVTTAWLA